MDTSSAKPAVAWLAEKAGRLKLNGRLRGYSPLSRLVELEGLETGVAGKRSLWQALSRAFPDDARLASFDLAALIARAEHQLQGTHEHRLIAAREALAADASGRAIHDRSQPVCGHLWLRHGPRLADRVRDGRAPNGA